MLHDIGKFLLRAEKESAAPDQNCRYYNGSYDFITQIKSELNKVLKNNSDVENSLGELVLNHYHPTNESQGIIALADSWSFGYDSKLHKSSGKMPSPDYAKEDSNTPLYSIFNNINSGNFRSAFPLRELSVKEENFFPKVVVEPKDGIAKGSYRKLWNDFSEEIKLLPTGSFEAFSETLLSLLKKYTWSVPADTAYMINVSLFDHLKMTAAFADCLFRYKSEYPDEFIWDDKLNRLSLKDGAMPVLLVGGDISGIQKFIYNIASQKAAVSLKGRSFYLQLLIDSIIQRILSEKDIKSGSANVVYSSGGKFYMILPATDSVKKALDALNSEFEKEIWDKHHGQLILNIDYVPFAYTGKGLLIDGEDERNIGDLWKTLADKLTSKKNVKFKSILVSGFNEMFTPQNSGGDVSVCAVTGIESDKCRPIDSKDKDSPNVMPAVKEQVMLGKSLKDAEYIYSETLTGEEGKERRDIYEICGIENSLPENPRKDIRRDSGFGKRLKKINDTDFLKDLSLDDISYGFQFYGGNQQAKIKNENKTFEQLANGGKLAILRMDVDGLGAIFIKGLSEKDKSFSAYSTLSFMLDYFFSGYLNTIRDKFGETVNILYSGGDDVFAVGYWNDTIAFAEQIRRDFRKFTGRGDISISGGISIIDSKFPIAKAAEMAGEAEEKAKKFDNGKKNAINIFGKTISWDEEFDFVKEWKKRFCIEHIHNNMPLSILHRIMLLNQKREKGNMSYIWHTTYYLTRFKDGKSNEVKDMCKDLQKLLINPRKYELIAIAARWAELELKELNRKKSE